MACHSSTWIELTRTTRCGQTNCPDRRRLGGRARALLLRNEHDLGGSAFQLILEHREISEAVCKRHDNLAVDDGGASIDLGGVGGFCGSVGPIIGRGG
jgi:hypothetical protein